MKHTVLTIACLLGLALAVRRTITLDTVVRDFNAAPQPNAHPNFEGPCGDARGVVGFELDADGKPYLISTKYSTLPNNATFQQFYRDVTGVNVKVLKSITLTETADGSGVYYYNNNNYFPIDGEGMSPYYYQSSGHNFHFTTEITTQFTYQGGEVFTFNGDDDVWVYINNRLAVDLGGCHTPETGTTSLDTDATKLGIVKGGTYTLKIFNAERHTSGSNFGVSTSIVLAPKPSNICGDGIIQSPEQCDAGTSNGAIGSCCTSNCTYASNTTVCRAAAGDCDVPETCTGSNATCPSDNVKPLGTPCGELFGACDVQLEKSCTGSDAQCHGPPPAITVLGSKFSDFTVTSFNSFTCHAGDVEGRMAIRNHAVLDGFTVGLKLTKATDGYRLITALVGGDVQWTSGSLHPDGKTDNVTVSGDAAYLYLHGNFSGDASQYINYIGNITDVQASFDAAQNYYVSIQSYLSALPVNAQATLQYGDGLAITCNNSSDLLNHVVVDGDMLSQTNWYSLKNCNLASRWVIDVSGVNDITIKGGQFPAVVERVIYNILGQNRQVNANNGVNGHIMAPKNLFSQPIGVTYGLVIAGDIPIAKQNNKPNCQNFKDVVITSKLALGVKNGDKIIYVVDYPALVKGDMMCVNGECHNVVSVTGSASSNAKRQEVGGGIEFDAPFSQDIPADTFVTMSYRYSQDRSAPLEYPVSSDSNMSWETEEVNSGLRMGIFLVSMMIAVFLL